MYHAIVKTEIKVNHESLYQEFKETLSQHLSVIYGPVKEWTGICVLDRQGVNKLDKLPELKKILTLLGPTNVTAVFYYNLKSNSTQHAHRDLFGNSIFNCSRIHIPLKTNEKAYLEVDHIKYHMGLGEVWAFDTSSLHRAMNEGDEDRVHIVIDLKRDPNTERFFPPRNFSYCLHMGRFVLFAIKRSAEYFMRNPSSIIKNLKDSVSLYKK